MTVRNVKQRTFEKNFHNTECCYFNYALATAQVTAPSGMTMNDKIRSTENTEAVEAYRIKIIARRRGRLGSTTKRLFKTARLWAENRNHDYPDLKQKCEPFNRNVRLYKNVKPGALGNSYP
jgi:hypothetical protein